LVHGDRSQLPLKTDTSWRPHEDVVQLREKIASLYVALQSAQSDQAAEMEKEKKNYQELLDDYRTVRSKLQDKRNRYTELEEKIAVQEAEHSRRIAEFEGTLRKFQRVHEHNINLITQQSSQVQTLQRDVQESRIRIEELEQEREQAIANRLQMDFFDNSVDRVSEAQLVGSMDSISSSVDELVSNFLDEVTELKSQNPEGATRDTTMLGKDAPVLLRAAVRTSPDSEKWGLLLDALLHEKVIGWLHRTLFSTTLGIPPSSSSTSLGQTLEDMYSVVSKNGKHAFDTTRTNN
jgi:myosin heavy subunit